MPSYTTTKIGSTPREKARARGLTNRADRLVWLDIVRLLCAVMILGIHWLRACFKLGMFGRQGEVNLVIGYQNQSIGLGMLGHVLVAGTGHAPWVWLTNSIGILGGFGWEGVSALIIVSGFSLTVSLRRRELDPRAWIAWFKKRATRILVPFYLVAIPFLIVYLALLGAAPHLHGAFGASLATKLHTVLQTPLLGVVLSHTLLFDPFNRQWLADFFAPAWWFIPAILVAYLAYPLIRGGALRFGEIPALATAAGVSMIAYHLADAGIFVNESWYFIALQEAFNLTLGVVAGLIWLDDGQRRARLMAMLFSPGALVIGALLFIGGNLANWSPSTRLFASILYGPGLVIIVAFLAKRLERTRVAALATSIDAYDLYLVHQPFAFPVALAAKIALHNYGVFVGWFVFVAIASLATMLLATIRRWIFREAKELRSAPKPLAVER